MKPTSDEVIDKLLERHGLSPRSRTAFLALLTQCVDEHLGPNEVLCEEGKPSDGLYLLLEGQLVARKRDNRNTPRDVATAEAPAVLGHMALVTGTVRTASLVCPDQARVARLPKASCDALLANPGEAGDLLRRMVLSAMIDQFERATDDVQRLLAEAEGRPHEQRELEGWTR